MNRPAPEPAHVVTERRRQALDAIAHQIPYIDYLGASFDRRGDELTGIMPFQDKFIGNPVLPAMHGGVTAAFLEITALVSLTWAMLWEEIERGEVTDTEDGFPLPHLPKTINLTVDYLRAGRPHDVYSRARINRLGRRHASVQVEAWQDNRDRPFAMTNCHFLIPKKSTPSV